MAQKNVLPVLDDLPFAIDIYEPCTSHKLQFSTHAHKDHLVGIAKFASSRAIWCTAMTKCLILMKYSSLVVGGSKSSGGAVFVIVTVQTRLQP